MNMGNDNVSLPSPPTQFSWLVEGATDVGNEGLSLPSSPTQPSCLANGAKKLGIILQCEEEQGTYSLPSPPTTFSIPQLLD
jgi:hypothetical protein